MQRHYEDVYANMQGPVDQHYSYAQRQYNYVENPQPQQYNQYPSYYYPPQQPAYLPPQTNEQYYQPQPQHSFFHNPLQPQEQYAMTKKQVTQNASVPKNNAPPIQKSPVNQFMNSFKSQDGSIDYNKMINTAGQMMGAFNQVSTMIKGLGGLFIK